MRFDDDDDGITHDNLSYLVPEQNIDDYKHSNQRMKALVSDEIDNQFDPEKY